MQTHEIEIHQNEIKIEPVLLKDEILDYNQQEQFHLENISTSKQLKGVYIKIEKKPDVTVDDWKYQDTYIEGNLNISKIEEEEIHIKDESEQRLEDAEKNRKMLIFDVGVKRHCQQPFAIIEEKSIKQKITANFKCNICEKSFNHKGHLNTHLLIHTGEKNFKCNVCQKSFTMKYSLNSHLLIHSSEKNFKCNICGKSFTHKYSLNLHLVIHTGEKNFKCNICEKSFTQRSSLNSHLVIHSGEKNFKCKECEKSFTLKAYLNSHLLVHSGERNFKCDICEKSFIHKTSLNSHLLIHSGGKKFKEKKFK